MLQQTRAETVVSYYDRFLSRYPTVQELADSQEEELLKYWEGLGYYSRARSIHKAAKQISWIVNAHTAKNVISDISATSEDFSLSEHDDITEVSKAVAMLGYDLSAEDISNVYTEFKRISSELVYRLGQVTIVELTLRFTVVTKYNFGC
jgi:hypothetical protein